MAAKPKGQGKKKPPKKTPKPAAEKKTELVPMTDAATAIIPKARQETLAAWFSLYLGIEVDQASNTFRAKRHDLELFLEYIVHHSGSDKPDLWTKSVTDGFVKHMLAKRKFAPTTVNRVLATLRHAASWIHKQKPFLAGHPLARIRDIVTEEPEWRGLDELAVNRLRSASEQLCHISTKGNQQPLRDHAILMTFLFTALRVSELVALELAQYKGKHLREIRRKGNTVTRELLLAAPAREALERYISEVRSKEPGPLFRSKSGARLDPRNVYDILKRIADQANATLPPTEHIQISPHVLRHTALRRAAEKHDVRYAMRLSGHTSSRYIWRYTVPTREQEEKALDELF